MNWRLQSGLAGIIGVLGLYVLFNPVTTTTLATGIIPWLLVMSGVIYLLSIFLRSRRRPLTMVFPGLVGSLLVYFGLSMKFGDPTTAGPVPLAFLMALLFIGSGVAKLMMALSVKKSKYRLLVLVPAVVSLAMGVVVLVAWQSVSAGLIGVLLGFELVADAVTLMAIALRERDGEAAIEHAGGNPSAGAVGLTVNTAPPIARAPAQQPVNPQSPNLPPKG